MKSIDYIILYSATLKNTGSKANTQNQFYLGYRCKPKIIVSENAITQGKSPGLIVKSPYSLLVTIDLI